MLCWTTASWATDIDDLASDQISVRELMRLETQQTLQRLRASGFGGPHGVGRGLSEPAGFSAPSASAARLVAIYGVGQKLMAEVRVDDRTLLFMRGQPQAIGPGRSHAMRLLSISDRCVEVSLGQRQESLCAPLSGADEG